jgi:hypothetical protein
MRTIEHVCDHRGLGGRWCQKAREPRARRNARRWRPIVGARRGYVRVGEGKDALHRPRRSRITTGEPSRVVLTTMAIADYLDAAANKIALPTPTTPISKRSAKGLSTSAGISREPLRA